MSEELQQEQQPAEASASLAAGFNKVRGEESPTEPVATPEPTAAPEPSPEPTPEPTPQPSPDDEEILPGITKGRAKELLAQVPSQQKAINSLAGRVGELVRTIKQQQAPAAEPGAEGAPARKLQADALKRLRTEYPELAEAMAEDLAGLMPEQQDPEKVAKLLKDQIDTAVTGVKRETERRLLTRDHRDWELVVTSSDFNLWKSTLPADEQETFDTSWDADVVGSYISKFKAHTEALAKQGQRKTARLEGAVVPKGDGGAATSKLPDSAGLSAGFNKVRRLHSP